MRTARTQLALWATLMTLPAISHATIIHSNFGPNFQYDLTDGNIIGNSFDPNIYAEADRFTPSVTTGFSSLTIALSCLALCPGLDPVIVSLTVDNGNQPGSVLESFIVPALTIGALGDNTGPIVLNSIQMPVLNADTIYWITTRTTLRDSIVWNWNSTGDSSDEAISTDGGATWVSPSGLTPGAFQVSGPLAVPEPAPFTMLLSGAVLLGLAKSFARRR